MSIFIQFVENNIAIFILAIIAFVVLIAAIVALIVFKAKQKSDDSAACANATANGGSDCADKKTDNNQ